jgi:nitrogen fixation NifU-like protein
MDASSSIDLDDLYQEIILDHYKNPRHFARLTEAEALVDEENPTCGDQILLTAELEDGRISDIKYEARGCAISVASSSMMSEALIGKTVDEAKAIVSSFVNVMKGEGALGEEHGDDVLALEGVKKYPLRIKCATMGWHALDHALDKLTS